MSYRNEVFNVTELHLLLAKVAAYYFRSSLFVATFFTLGLPWFRYAGTSSPMSVVCAWRIFFAQKVLDVHGWHCHVNLSIVFEKAITDVTRNLFTNLKKKLSQTCSANPFLTKILHVSVYDRIRVADISHSKKSIWRHFKTSCW